MPPFGSVTRPSRFEELVSREPRRCPTRQKRRGRHAGDTVTPWRGIHASADAVAKRRRGDRAGGARGGALLAGRRAYRRPPCSVLRAGGCRRVPRHHARSAAASSHRADRGRWSRSTVPRALPGFSSSIEYASQPHGETGHHIQADPRRDLDTPVVTNARKPPDRSPTGLRNTVGGFLDAVPSQTRI